MAGTSPAMTAEKTTYGFQRFTSSLPCHHPLIRRLQALADARPRFPAPLHAQNGPPSDSNNHGFSADVSVWRGFVRRLMGSRFGGDIPWTGGLAGFMLGIGAKGDEAT